MGTKALRIVRDGTGRTRFGSVAPSLNHAGDREIQGMDGRISESRQTTVEHHLPNFTSRIEERVRQFGTGGNRVKSRTRGDNNRASRSGTKQSGRAHKQFSPCLPAVDMPLHRRVHSALPNPARRGQAGTAACIRNNTGTSEQNQSRPVHPGRHSPRGSH